MCLLIVKEKGLSRVSWEHLTNGWNANSDGVGIAWTKWDGFVSFKKFLDFQDFKSFYKSSEFAGKEEDYAIMYHFRWATHWSVKLQNVHPFVLSSSPRDILKTEGKARSVVGHNGIISNIGVDYHMDFSDTMVFVRDILSSKAIRDNMEDVAIQELLENFIWASKIAILDGTGKFTFVKKHIGIIEKDWVWYSNSGYKSYKSSYRPLSLPSNFNWDDNSAFDFEERKALKEIESSLNKPFESSGQRKKALMRGDVCNYCQCTVSELKSDWMGSKVCNECYESYFNN